MIAVSLLLPPPRPQRSRLVSSPHPRGFPFSLAAGNAAACWRCSFPHTVPIWAQQTGRAIPWSPLSFLWVRVPPVNWLVSHSLLLLKTAWLFTHHTRCLARGGGLQLFLPPQFLLLVPQLLWVLLLVFQLSWDPRPSPPFSMVLFTCALPHPSPRSHPSPLLGLLISFPTCSVSPLPSLWLSKTSLQRALPLLRDLAAFLPHFQCLSQGVRGAFLPLSTVPALCSGSDAVLTVPQLSSVLSTPDLPSGQFFFHLELTFHPYPHSPLKDYFEIFKIVYKE